MRVLVILQILAASSLSLTEGGGDFAAWHSNLVARYKKDLASNREKRQTSCDTNAIYRTADGTCNNANNQEWGANGATLKRMLDPVYDDHKEVPRLKKKNGDPLPSPRSVSVLVHDFDRVRPLNRGSVMLMEWGQFLAHDITWTPTANVTENDGKCCYTDDLVTGGLQHPDVTSGGPCHPIIVTSNTDRYFNQSVSHRCKEFARSEPVFVNGVRQQKNELSAYIDGQNVYGHDDEQTAALRENDGTGRLKTKNNNLPESETNSTKVCIQPSEPDYCMAAAWSYNESCDASLYNVFSTAAFRFGHSMVPDGLLIDGEEKENVDLFERPEYVLNSLDSLLSGIVSRTAERADRWYSEGMTDHLFERSAGEFMGTDIASLNIQRGRDHGLPAYNKWRELCEGVEPFTSITELDSARRFQNAYGNDVNDVDLYSGALNERPVRNGIVGPTYACLLGKQFANIRNCDRFWFENTNTTIGFSDERRTNQQREIRRMRLSNVICLTTNIDQIQGNAFEIVDSNRGRKLHNANSPERGAHRATLKRIIHRVYDDAAEKMMKVRQMCLTLLVLFVWLVTVKAAMYRPSLPPEAYRWRTEPGWFCRLVFFLLLRHRWYIRLMLYGAFWRQENRLNRLQEREFRYDVFVAYDSEDLGWVRTHLVPMLETGLGLRLCIHQRDFTPGVPVVVNIMENVQASKTMMMVFSKNFAESEWCQFELQLCLSHVMEYDDTLLVVLLHDIPSRDITPAMEALMKTTTYIEWEAGAESKDEFWGRIRRALNDILPDV
nr:hypothetical protein BaRGS_018482 [Batillaria attramentaria]